MGESNSQQENTYKVMKKTLLNNIKNFNNIDVMIDFLNNKIKQYKSDIEYYEKMIWNHEKDLELLLYFKTSKQKLETTKKNDNN